MPLEEDNFSETCTGCLRGGTFISNGYKPEQLRVPPGSGRQSPADL